MDKQVLEAQPDHGVPVSPTSRPFPWSLVVIAMMLSTLVWGNGAPEERIASAHQGSVTRVRTGAQGQYCLTVGEDSLVRVWDTTRRNLVTEWRPKQGNVLDVALTGAGGREDLLLALTDEGMLTGYSLVSRGELFQAQTGGKHLAVSPDGLAVGVKDEKDLRVYTFGPDMRQPTQVLTLPSPAGDFAFQPAGALMAVGGENGSLALHRVWSGGEASEPIRCEWRDWVWGKLPGAATGPVREVSFNGNGRYLLAQVGPKLAGVWEMGEHPKLVAAFETPGAIKSLAFGELDDFVVSVTDAGVSLWQTSNGDWMYNISAGSAADADPERVTIGSKSGLLLSADNKALVLRSFGAEY